MRHAKFPLLLLYAAVLAGCVREKLTDCLTTVAFSYKGDGSTDIFAEHVKAVDLYVFDENHRLVEGFAPYIPTPEELAAQKADLLLPTSRSYNIVAVGNFEDSKLYSLREGTIDSVKILHPGHSMFSGGTDNIDSHPHLYFGREGVTIPPTAGSTHTIEMGSSHVDMVVEVAGLGGPTTRQGGGSLSLEHSNLPGWTDFSSNCICPRGDLVSHFVDCEWDAEKDVYTFSYQVMRDLKGGKRTLGSFLHLYDGEEDLLRDNPINVEQFIREHLMTNPEILDPYDDNGVLIHEAVVPIRIEFKAVGVEVSIPEWFLKDVPPEF